MFQDPRERSHNVNVVSEHIQRELEQVIQALHRATLDVGDEVEQMLRDGLERPLSREDAITLLRRVVEILRERCEERGDAAGARSLADTEAVVGRAIAALDSVRPDRATAPEISLLPMNGAQPGPVKPTPIFHTRPIPMNAGYVRLSDIRLWDANERLDIHLGQFRQKHGRRPTHEELVDIMTDKLKLPGMPAEEQFKIPALARSIAANGVQKPPILAYDGRLLDGNRRVAACHYIINSDEFSLEQKKRAEHIYVWRLTEHADDRDENAVVVALNFEDDCKQPWPDYIKARRLYEEWMDILALEPYPPNQRRQAVLKRELSLRFALGPQTNVVNRYLKMMDWASQFEDYLIEQRGRDSYEVKHKANEYFQYFDEVSKGASPGGVAHALNEDENYKHIAFDLLYQGKFRNWNLIRKLKYFDEDVRKGLLAALAVNVHDGNDTELERAQDIVEETLDDAHARRAESRKIGANARIEVFVKFLEDLPIAAFRDEVTPENLRRLLSALRFIEGHVKSVLAEHDAS